MQKGDGDTPSPFRTRLERSATVRFPLFVLPAGEIGRILATVHPHGLALLLAAHGHRHEILARGDRSAEALPATATESTEATPATAAATATAPAATLARTCLTRPHIERARHLRTGDRRLIG